MLKKWMATFKRMKQDLLHLDNKHKLIQNELKMNAKPNPIKYIRRKHQLAISRDVWSSTRHTKAWLTASFTQNHCFPNDPDTSFILYNFLQGQQSDYSSGMSIWGFLSWVFFRANVDFLPLSYFFQEAHQLTICP